jgi:hypothetical protein
MIGGQPVLQQVRHRQSGPGVAAKDPDPIGLLRPPCPRDLGNFAVAVHRQRTDPAPSAHRISTQSDPHFPHTRPPLPQRSAPAMTVHLDHGSDPSCPDIGEPAGQDRTNLLVRIGTALLDAELDRYPATSTHSRVQVQLRGSVDFRAVRSRPERQPRLPSSTIPTVVGIDVGMPQSSA